MAANSPSWWFRPRQRSGAGRDDFRVAGRGELREAAAFAEAQGVNGILVGARITEKMTARGVPGDVLTLRVGGQLQGVCWCGGTLMPAGFADSDIPSLAAFTRARSSGCTSVVGEARIVLPLWDSLARTWPRPRAVRPDQPLFQITEPSAIVPDPHVRRAREGEIDVILPASIAMFTEELGFAPPGAPGGYRARVADLIRRGRTYVRLGPTAGARQGVQFKADLGAVLGSAVQVHGVWTHPQLRGQGLARRGMAAVIADALARGFTTISLYVNSFNAPALAAYRAVGFERVGTWATVLL